MMTKCALGQYTIIFSNRKYGSTVFGGSSVGEDVGNLSKTTNGGAGGLLGGQGTHSFV